MAEHSLTVGQKLLNQRLLAAHCITEKDARSLWKELDRYSNGAMGGSTLEETIMACNEQLYYAGLEIISVSMNNEGGVAGGDGNSNKYFAMINKFPDDIAKTVFSHRFSPPQNVYVRRLLEALTTDGPVKRSALLNLRLETEGADSETKALALPAAEHVVNTLLEEKWIRSVKGADTANGAMLALAPRAYAELSYLLVQEFGMSKDDIPQQVFYRR